MIGQDAGRAGALEGQQSLEDQRVAVARAGRGGGLDHRILAAHLVGEGRHAERVLHSRDDVEIGQARLHHHEVGALGEVELDLAQRLVDVRRVHLVAALVALQPAERADRLAEGAVEGRGIFGCISHDRDVLVPRLLERRADRADAAVHHVRGRDDVRAGLGLDQGLVDQDLDRVVVDDVAGRRR